MDTQRIILFVVLAFLLLMLWQKWIEYSSPPALPQQSATVQPEIADGGSPPVPAAPGLPDAPTVGTAPAPASDTTTGGNRVTVTTDLLRVELNTLGANLNKAWLLRYPVDVDQPDNPFKLLHDDGSEVFVVQGGLLGHGREYPNHKTRFTSAQADYRLADGQDTLDVEFVWNAPDGVTYKKIYTFHRDSYRIDVQFRVVNSSDSDWRGYQYQQYRRSEPPSQEFGLMTVIPSYTGGAIYNSDSKYDKIDFADMRDADFKQPTDNGWLAMLQHYFVSAMLLESGKGYELYSRALPGGQYLFGYTTTDASLVPAGQGGELRLAPIYVGPKEVRRLEAQAEGLQLTVDYGWLTPISAPLFWVLDKIHVLVGNWGWAIIILTLLIKLAFYPLSAASSKSMANMRRMAPRIQTLKERFGDDKQKLNQAMMELYKKEKINPLGGCLPILIQIPVFIALYWALLESVELRQAPWILWIRDLSAPDPYFVLPIIMGVSMLVQQLISAVSMDPMQKKIMMALPIVFTFFFLFFPAGLVLYWTVNNLLTIAQQWHINRQMGV